MHRLLTKALVLSAIVAGAAAQAVPANANIPSPSVTARHVGNAFDAGTSKRLPANSRLRPSSSPLSCGVQFSSWIAPYASQNWFTYNWSPASYIDWTLMNDTTWSDGKVSLTNVAEERVDSNDVTYWLTVQNQSANWQYFEARYCYLG